MQLQHLFNGVVEIFVQGNPDPIHNYIKTDAEFDGHIQYMHAFEIICQSYLVLFQVYIWL